MGDDSNALLRMSDLSGIVAEGDVVGVEQALRGGAIPLLLNPFAWPLPSELTSRCVLDPSAASPERIAVLDELIDVVAGVVVLRPPSLVVAITANGVVDAADLLTVITDTLARARLARSAVAFVVSSSQEVLREAEALGFPIAAAAPDADALRSALPHTVLEHVALRAAGTGANLVVAERLEADIAVCVVRRKPTVDLHSLSPAEQEA